MEEGVFYLVTGVCALWPENMGRPQEDCVLETWTENFCSAYVFLTIANFEATTQTTLQPSFYVATIRGIQRSRDTRKPLTTCSQTRIAPYASTTAPKHGSPGNTLRTQHTHPIYTLHIWGVAIQTVVIIIYLLPQRPQTQCNRGKGDL